ncbi:GM14098 [Drosophila sechellia]|uniref:GM14098 n=1 Tax=Drosophila sechellia TaxID=7238 RepID=B4HTH3_DROSE|nr:GM14098 [Drosophila sechellia]
MKNLSADRELKNYLRGEKAGCILLFVQMFLRGSSRDFMGMRCVWDSQCNARIYGTCPQGPASVSCVQRSSGSNSTAATSTAPQQQQQKERLIRLVELRMP